MLKTFNDINSYFHIMNIIFQENSAELYALATM